VPGGRDIPLHPLERFSRPLGRYARFLGNDADPWFADDEIAVAGLSTARARSVRRVSRGQADEMTERLRDLPRGVTRVIVARHPVAVACRTDLTRAGHLRARRADRLAERSAGSLVVQAGTAPRTRERDATHAFNFVRIDGVNVHIDRYEWDVERGNFVLGRAEAYEQEGGAWKPRHAVKVMTTTPPHG
jgi:hypothetical protein